MNNVVLNSVKRRHQPANFERVLDDILDDRLPSVNDPLEVDVHRKSLRIAGRSELFVAIYHPIFVQSADVGSVCTPENAKAQ